MAYIVTNGNDNFTLAATAFPDQIYGGIGNDTFTFSGNKVKNGFVIDGGTHDSEIDAVVIPMYYGLNSSGVAITSTNKADFTGTPTISTALTTLGTANNTDKIVFKKTGDFSNLEFAHIERIELSSGVAVTLSADALMNAIASLDYEDSNGDTLNSGVHFYGVSGGAAESVNIIGNFDDNTFTPAATVIGATATTYSLGDFQLDDASIANMFHDVILKVNFAKNSTTSSYARGDGTNSDDYFTGGNGVDYATMRLGSDTYLGGTGNDVLSGGEGADSLDGGEGNDFFLISGFQTGIAGSSHKSDTGTAEWVTTGNKKDVIIGGSGVDTLRITAGADTKAHGTIVLNDSNFKGMEVVEVGATVSKINVEDSALQMLNDHYYLNAAGVGTTGTGLKVDQTFDNVVVDATEVTTNGLKFIGNGNANTFIGTNKSDTFIGNGGNDTLTGGSGQDFFQFGKVHTQKVTGGATASQRYVDDATALTGTDTIVDFRRTDSTKNVDYNKNADKIVLDDDQFTALASLGSIAAGNLIIGSAAVDADDFLLFNSTTNTLSYDADGNGAGTSVDIAVLTGISTLTFNDFILI